MQISSKENGGGGGGLGVFSKRIRDRFRSTPKVRPSFTAPKELKEKFDGHNFHTWQTKVKFTLMKKGLWEVISTNITHNKGKFSTTRIKKS